MPTAAAPRRLGSSMAESGSRMGTISPPLAMAISYLPRRFDFKRGKAATDHVLGPHGSGTWSPCVGSPNPPFELSAAPLRTTRRQPREPSRGTTERRASSRPSDEFSCGQGSDYPHVLNAQGDHIVRANGVELCVETFGDPDDPAILLIHGAGSSMLSWNEELCARLADGHRLVVRYDSRDAGRSVSYEPGAPQYELRDLVADAIGLLDTLSLAGAHVVGMSQGGLIGQLLALDHPDRVASLTLASTTPFDGQQHPDLPGASAELRAFFANEPPQPDWTDRAAVIDYLVEAERPFAARSRPFDEAAMRDLAGQVFDRAANIAANVTNPFLAGTGDPWRGRLGEISAPALVIHGEEDPMFPLAHAHALANEIPGAELLALEGTGHEYFPPHTWEVVVPAILRHSAAR